MPYINNEKRERLKKEWIDSQITHTTRGSTLNLDKVAEHFLDKAEELVEERIQAIHKVITIRVKDLCAEHDRTGDRYTYTRMFEAKYIRYLSILNQ